MQNHINIGEQNVQHTGQNSNTQPAQIVEKLRINYWMISTLSLIVVVVSMFAWFYASNKTNKVNQNTATSEDNQAVSPTPTQAEVTRDKNTPTIAVFMRKGIVYLRNFRTNQESKISTTIRVGNPKLSPNGKYVVYFSIIHAAGGFPTENVYLADTQGLSEANLGVTNNYASRLTWSNGGSVVGLVLFPSGATGKALATIYDASTKTKVEEAELNTLRDDQYGHKVLTVDKSYDVDLNCTKQAQNYVEFCNQFQSILNSNQTPPLPNYKSEELSKSSYVKPGYKLIRSEKLSNGLIILEFYTGEPQNPESKWGEGGGSFIPGYDEGVTETYTVLLNEKVNKVVVEILDAVDTQFLF